MQKKLRINKTYSQLYQTNLMTTQYVNLNGHEKNTQRHSPVHTSLERKTTDSNKLEKEQKGINQVDKREKH